MTDDAHGGRRVRTPEEWVTAALLRMVLEHCTSDAGTLDSGARTASNEAIQLLAESGFLRIDDDIGGRIRATVLPKTAAFLTWMEPISRE